jgi:hypothetical protein
VREQIVEHEPGATLVIHSDGLTSKWDGSLLRAYSNRNPTVIGAVLLRDAGLRQDDATVVVLSLVS